MKVIEHRVKMFLPTADGWSPLETVRNVLEMKQVALESGDHGPWIVRCGPSWDRWMDDDYMVVSAAAGIDARVKTLRDRLREIDGVVDVRTDAVLSYGDINLYLHRIGLGGLLVKCE